MQNIVLMLSIFLFACSSQDSSKPKRQTEVQVLAGAYEYGFPLVLMDMTREVSVNEAHEPMNQFSHATKMPDANFKTVVRPNVDTLYSTAMLDLEKEPLVLEVPNTKGRYYLMPVYDAWTNVISSPGARTSGTKKDKFVLVGPNWNGQLPSGVKTIHSPTNMAWIIGRTQTNGPEDAKKTVAKIQQGYKLYPLSEMGKQHKAAAGVKKLDVTTSSPVEKVFALSTEDYFNRLNKLMMLNPPALADRPTLAKFSKYGVGPGEKFVINAMNPRELRLLRDLPKTERSKFEEEKHSFGKPINGWLMTQDLGEYGTDYHKRAIVAYSGPGANLSADAIYPTAVTDGLKKQLNGKNNYVLHFNKDEIPKTKAFWSLTVYDPDSFLVKNSINRFSIGDRDKLTYNSDGSLDIYLQNSSPGKEKEANWLPIPKGEFSVTARIYWPEERMLSPTYSLPPIMPATNAKLKQAEEEKK